MKNHPIPAIDLACIAPLPYPQKRAALEGFKTGHPPYSYGPMRRFLLESLNVDAGPLALAQRASWPQLANAISRKCKSDDEAVANLAVAKSVYDFGSAQVSAGRKQDFYPLSAAGGSQRLTFWVPAVVSVDDRPTVVFIDPRRATKRLTPLGRKFVFSVMHERIRVADPDFAEVELGILQFGSKTDKQDRPVSVWKAGDMELFSFDEIDAFVRETYEIWRDVNTEREQANKARQSRQGGSRG